MDQRFFSIKEAAKYCSLSQRLLYEVVANKEIRSYKIHTRIVIDVKDLDEYIRRNVQEVRDWAEEAEELVR